MEEEDDAKQAISRAMLSAIREITCIKCNKRTVYVAPNGKPGKLCARCLLKAFSDLPNPDCEVCLGQGEYYFHSDDCDDDLCALAGGYHDCTGKVVDCDCSIFDNWGSSK